MRLVVEIAVHVHVPDECEIYDCPPNPSMCTAATAAVLGFSGVQKQYLRVSYPSVMTSLFCPMKTHTPLLRVRISTRWKPYLRTSGSPYCSLLLLQLAAHSTKCMLSLALCN